MNQERIAMRQERLDRINAALSETGYRVYHQWSNLDGSKSKRPYRLVYGFRQNQLIGSYQFAETAHEKALKLIGVA